MPLGSKLAKPPGVIISHRLTIGKRKIGFQVSDLCSLGYLFYIVIREDSMGMKRNTWHRKVTYRLNTMKNQRRGHNRLETESRWEDTNGG